MQSEAQGDLKYIERQSMGVHKVEPHYNPKKGVPLKDD